MNFPSQIPAPVRVLTGWIAAAGLSLVSLSGPGPAPAAAQEAAQAYSYEVRFLEDPEMELPDGDGEETLGVPDFSADRSPRRVVQGSRVALLGSLGEELTWETARRKMLDNMPVRPAGGALDGLAIAKMWQPPVVEPAYDELSVDVRRGDHDETIAGRQASHYVLEAELRRTVHRRGQHYLITAHLWVLEDLPFSWIAFGTGSDDLPSHDRELRGALEEELTDLGLVARALTEVRFRLVPVDDARPSTWSVEKRGFEIANLAAAEAPAGPSLPVVTRDYTTRMMETIMARPGEFCGAVSEGQAPEAITDGAPEALDQDQVVARLAGLCQEQTVGLFFGILEEGLEDPEASEENFEALCRAVSAAESPDALAEALFTDEQARGFREMLTAGEKEQFVAKIRPACGG